MNDTDREKESFDRVIQDYLDAFNSGDYRRVASYWAEDAVHVPPIGGEIRGRDALEAFYKHTCETMKGNLSDYSYECCFSGAYVMVRESWKVTVSPPGEESTSSRGKGMWVGRKGADGVWRAFWGLARLDEPLPA
jgi:uncharacterized protein (TIGR02246 family)